MKTLIISKVHVVGVLILGLILSWHVATPRIITGEVLTGGWTDCSTITNPYCRNQLDRTCTIRHDKCDTSGNLKCYEPGGLGSRPCYDSAECIDEASESCG